MSSLTRIATLESRALVAVDGPEWRPFLQGLLTQDVETLAPGELRFGALLTPQGRLLFDLFILGREDGCALDCQACQRDDLIRRLTIYRLRAKVRIEADPAPVLAGWGERPEGEGWIADPRTPQLGWRGYGVAARPDAAETDYDAHRLSLAVPGPADWGADDTFPLEADFDLLNGVDFKKGCFVGQETTSRMKRRGAVRSRMLALVCDGPAPPKGAEILAGGRLRAGEVLSGAGEWAIALVRLDRIEGQPLTVNDRPCRVERPPWMPAEG